MTDIAFRLLCAQDGPDHATIARFRVDAQDAFRDLFSQVLVIAARAGLGRFGTVAIDGTKIMANASMDANRGREWFDRQVAAMLEHANQVDKAEDASAFGDHGDERLDRVPADLADRTLRRDRIQRAALELEAETQRRAGVDAERERAALARRRRSEDGQPVVGRIPNGPHRLAEAHAHLAREIAIHQAKLDRHAALVAAGKKPMGRPPLPMQDSSRVARARRAVRNAEAPPKKRRLSPSQPHLRRTCRRLSRIPPTRSRGSCRLVEGSCRATTPSSRSPATS